MTYLAFINFIIILLGIALLYYLIKIYFQHSNQKNNLNNYINNASLLSPAEQQEIATGLSNDENNFKRAVGILLVTTLMVVLFLCILLSFSKTAAAFTTVILVFIMLAILSAVLYKTSISRRNVKIIAQLPNAIDLIIHYTLSNVSLAETMRLVEKQVRKPLGNFFRQVNVRVAGGENMGRALRESARPYRLFQLDYFVMVLILQQETGADTIKVLRRLVDLLRKEQILQQRIKILTVDVNIAQWGVGISIVFVFLLIYFTKPEYMQAFLHSSIFFPLFIVTLLLFILGLLVIRKLMRVA